MNILRVFGIGSKKILAKGCQVKGMVSKVQNSRLYVVKKPVRLLPNERNTLYSHYITFAYTVNNIPYQGTLFVSLRHRCPQIGESIDVYYDPENPENYACYAFDPAVRPIGW